MIRIDRTYKRVVIGTWLSLALLAIPVAVAPAAAQVQVQPIIGAGNQGQQQQQTQDQLQQQSSQQQQKAVNDQSTVINSNAVPNLIQLPGFVGAYPNFTQPYKPDVFINGAGPVRPISMTYAQAKACDGNATDSSGKSIKLYYPQWDKVAPAGDFSGYVGSVRVEEKDGFWIEAVCEGARKAMDKGASEGVVEYVIRPVNRTWGIGGSASFGGSGMPAAGANPYALAGAVGLGMGISGAYVKGELMLTVTGFKSGNVKSARIEEGGSGPRPVSLTVETEKRMNLRPEVVISGGQ